jgi:hypothetical protein
MYIVDEYEPEEPGIIKMEGRSSCRVSGHYLNSLTSKKKRGDLPF